jgi:hypothetical protein
MSFLFCLGRYRKHRVPAAASDYDVVPGQDTTGASAVDDSRVSGIAPACSRSGGDGSHDHPDRTSLNFDMVKVLSVTIPAAIVGIIVSGLVMMRRARTSKRS